MPMDELDRQAIKRGDCELIAQNRSGKDLRDEMNARTYKSGLTNRQGECSRASGKIMSIVSFGKAKLNIWPRDASGQLIE